MRQDEEGYSWSRLSNGTKFMYIIFANFMFSFPLLFPNFSVPACFEEASFIICNTYYTFEPIHLTGTVVHKLLLLLKIPSYIKWRKALKKNEERGTRLTQSVKHPTVTQLIVSHGS